MKPRYRIFFSRVPYSNGDYYLVPVVNDNLDWYGETFHFTSTGIMWFPVMSPFEKAIAKAAALTKKW